MAPMAHQIDLPRVPRLADTGCLEADNKAGWRTQLDASAVTHGGSGGRRGLAAWRCPD